MQPRLLSQIRITIPASVNFNGDKQNNMALHLRLQKNSFRLLISLLWLAIPALAQSEDYKNSSKGSLKGVVKDGNEESATPTVNTKEIIPSANEQYYTVALQPEDFVERDINWVRLRDVTLTFDFPKSMLGAQNVIKNLSIFVNGTDLFLSTNYTGADPYVSTTTPATGGAGGFGMDFGKISLPRTVSAGLSVTF